MEIAGLIKLEKRAVAGGRANKRLRRSGYLPGNIYARGMESVPVMVKKDALRKNLNKFGRSAIFKLELDDGKTYNAMVKDIQIESLSGQYLHVDFQQVSLSEEIKANVSIKIEGKASLELKKLILIQHMDFVPIKGLPQDIPNTIDIDVSKMQLGENIFISDVQFPKGIVSEMNPEQLVISVSEPKEHVQESVDEDDNASAEIALS